MVSQHSNGRYFILDLHNVVRFRHGRAMPDVSDVGRVESAKRGHSRAWAKCRDFVHVSYALLDSGNYRLLVVAKSSEDARGSGGFISGTSSPVQLMDMPA